MNSLADINVIFAILVEEHVHHREAWAWWDKQPSAGVGLCDLTRLGVLRLLSSPVVMKGRPLTPDEAMDCWDRLLEDPRSFRVAAPSEEFEFSFRRMIQGRKPSMNVWSDAWLAALAESSQLKLVSFDGGFRSFDLQSFEWLRSNPTRRPAS